MANEQARKERIAKVVVKAWKDDTFKQQLLSDPARVLADHDVAMPAGVTVHVHEDTATDKHVVLPKKPDEPILDNVHHGRVIMMETIFGDCDDARA
ncbi:MAG TPA: NHLP leader peptide family RiPP precursor [Gemmatimonadales bacterium]|jgi:hypothetical protein